MPFKSTELTVTTSDGWHFVLVEPLYFTCLNGDKYRGITGATTDGASTDRSIWSIYPPFGTYFLSAVLHDCAYRCMLEKLVDGVWRRVQLSKDECDALLLEAMESQGVDSVTANVIFQAVKKFGDKSFLDDLAQPIK